MNITKLILVFLSAVFVMAADTIIKKISNQSFVNVLKDPWMIAICSLYFVQIIFAIIVFMLKGELSIYTNLFIVFYGIFGVAIGMLLFKEVITTVQWVGIIMGIIGTVLMTRS